MVKKQEPSTASTYQPTYLPTYLHTYTPSYDVKLERMDGPDASRVTISLHKLQATTWEMAWGPAEYALRRGGLFS